MTNLTLDHGLVSDAVKDTYAKNEKNAFPLELGYEDQVHYAYSYRELIDHVLLSTYFDVSLKTGKNHFITADTSNTHSLNTLKKLEEAGCYQHFVKKKADGSLDLEQLKALINPKTALVTLSWANPITGVIESIDEISKICQEKGVLLHVDASYVIGKLYFSLIDLPIDFLTIAGSVIHGFEHTALLIAKEKFSKFHIDPAYAASLNKALSLSISYLDKMAMDVGALREILEEDAEVVYRNSLRLPNVTCLRFPKVFGPALVQRLKKRKILVSKGPGLSDVSFHLHRYHTLDEIKKVKEVLTEEVTFLQGLSEGVFV